MNISSYMKECFPSRVLILHSNEHTVGDCILKEISTFSATEHTNTPRGRELYSISKNEAKMFRLPHLFSRDFLVIVMQSKQIALKITQLLADIYWNACNTCMCSDVTFGT